MTDELNAKKMATFFEASDHPYECRCEKCKEWWRAVGPEMEDDDTPIGYGPFGENLDADPDPDDPLESWAREIADE